MGCGSSQVPEDLISSRELTKVITETGKNDGEENNTAKEKNAALVRCNNNNRRSDNSMVAVNGTQIHLPGRANDESGLEISHLSANQQNAINKREREERERQEEYNARKAIDEEGKKTAEINGQRKNLVKLILDIKKNYDRASLASHEIGNAATRVRSCEKSAGHDTSPKITNSFYQEKMKELSKYQQEKSRMLHKLSEIASAKLRHNNANLADLSDPNRASKLAERVSELYDNEWTDVFDAVRKSANKTDVPDIAIVESLREILQFCYQLTSDLSTKQTELLYKALYKIPTKTSIHVTLHVQSLQKQTVNVSKQFFQKKICQCVGQKMKGDVIVKRISLQKSPLQKYIDLCSELSWYMHIQSPPMELDFKGGDLPMTRFRPYLSTGPTLDYVVWPALLLHTDGPLVAKGVAEYTKSNKNNTASGSNNKKKTGSESEW